MIFFLTGEFRQRVREMLSDLFVTLYTLSIYPSAHKQLRRHLPKTFANSLVSLNRQNKSIHPSSKIYLNINFEKFQAPFISFFQLLCKKCVQYITVNLHSLLLTQ